VLDHASIEALATKYRGRPIDIRINDAGIISSSEGSIAEVKRPGGYFYRSSKSAVNMVTAKATLEDTGKFRDYRGGELPW
jgi:hypothetical protein